MTVSATLQQNEPTYLIHTTELEVDIEVLLVECLQARVQKTTEQWTLNLLDNLGTGLLGIVLCYNGTKLVVIEVVLF